MRKSLELKENINNAYQNLRKSAKAVIKRKIFSLVVDFIRQKLSTNLSIQSLD